MCPLLNRLSGAIPVIMTARFDCLAKDAKERDGSAIFPELQTVRFAYSTARTLN